MLCAFRRRGRATASDDSDCRDAMLECVATPAERLQPPPTSPGPFPAARHLRLAGDPLPPFPFAGEFDERVPARMSLHLFVLVDLVAMVMAMFVGMHGVPPETVRQCDPALQPVAEPRALRTL